ncbi:hypothetical protein cypCar_00038722 [Cyprinus carpio]|nr:hypothetical protein cypCar_00038722 [Cyprinus carpio]
MALEALSEYALSRPEAPISKINAQFIVQGRSEMEKLLLGKKKENKVETELKVAKAYALKEDSICTDLSTNMTVEGKVEYTSAGTTKQARRNTLGIRRNFGSQAQSVTGVSKLMEGASSQHRAGQKQLPKQTESKTDVGNVTKVRETELSLNPGSPLVMTHHINLVQGACTGGCETEMATLRDRVEFLEKEMAAIKKNCVQCSREQCPKNCSGQGKCEERRCVCFQGFSGPDCSGKTCPSNCNIKGKCVKGKCVCQTGYTGLDCSKGK